MKLDANENPYGPSPKALAALASGKYFHIYPDPESNDLREALSAYTGVTRERLLAGMGADELIDLVLRVVFRREMWWWTARRRLACIRSQRPLTAAPISQSNATRIFSLDVAGIETAVTQHHAKILILCSPNNPDGSTIDDDTLRRLLNLPVLVLLDEAYADFAEVRRLPQPHLDWVLEYDNLAVLRTFSKLAGLAGLRVGYGAFPEWLLPHLWKIKQPYNINVAASLAALASLDDKAWLAEKMQALIAERQRMSRELAEISYLQPYPTQSNFVLCRVLGRDAEQLKVDLEQAGILVRYFNKPGLDNCIRISAGLTRGYGQIVAALQEIEALRLEIQDLKISNEPEPVEGWRMTASTACRPRRESKT